MEIFKGWYLVLVTTAGTYVELLYIGNLALTSVRTFKVWETPYGVLWCNLTHRRDSQVFSMGKAIFEQLKKPNFQASEAIKQQRRIP